MTLHSWTSTYTATRTLEPTVQRSELRELCAGTRPWEWIIRGSGMLIWVFLMWKVMQDNG